MAQTPTNEPVTNEPDPQAPPVNEPTPPVEPPKAAEPQEPAQNPTPEPKVNEPVTEPRSAETTNEPAEPQNTPPQPGDYVIPDGVPETIRQRAAEEGWTQEQLEADVNYWAKHWDGERKKYAEHLRAEGEKLLDSWGENKDYHLSLAQQAVKFLDYDKKGSFSEMIKATGMGNNPVMLEALRHLGDQLQEGGYVKTQTYTPPQKKSTAELLFPKSG